jgi:predicted nucleic acid-binding protein
MTSSRDRFVPDTHPLVWFFTEDRRISPAAEAVLAAAETGDVELIIPTIVLSELLWVCEHKNPGITTAETLERITRIPQGLIANFDMPVFELLLTLPSDLEMHDRIIAATAKLYNAALVTRDRKLIGVVPTLW